MASQWHYSRDGKDFGPVSSAELKKLAATGKLLRTDFLWKEGMAEWKPAGAVSGLFPEEEAASVAIVEEEPADDPLASLKFDVTPARKRSAKTASSSRNAPNRRRQKSGGVKTWLMYGGGAFLCLMILGAFADKKQPPKQHLDDRGGGGVVGRGGGSSATTNENDPLEGCPRGASDEFKRGWADAILFVKSQHDQCRQSQEWLVQELKDLPAVYHERAQSQHQETVFAARGAIEDRLQKVKEVLESGGNDPRYDWQRGNVGGYQYGLRQILQQRY